MALTATAALEVADAKTILGITTSSDDALLATLINAATQAAENNDYGPFIRRAAVEYHIGLRKTIYLRQYPLVSVTSIVDPAGNVVPATDYRLELEMGRLVHWGRFPQAAETSGQPSRWTVTYVGGWFGSVTDTATANRLTVLDDVKLAIARLVGMVYERRTPGVSEVRVLDLLVRYTDVKGWPPEVTMYLAPYRRNALVI